MATRSLPRSSSGEVIRERIQRIFTQLTQGCGRSGCNNPDCATGTGRSMSATVAATRAVALVQSGRVRLCEPLASPEQRTQSGSVAGGTSSEHGVQEVRAGGGRSEPTLPPPHTPVRPILSEPMELAFSSSDVHGHSTRQLVIGSSSSSMVQSFSRSRGSPSASVDSQRTTSTGATSSSSSSSSSSAASSGPLMASSSSSSSSSAIVQMASSNMVEEVARMEVSPTPHPTLFSPSPSPSSSSSQRAGSSNKPDSSSIPMKIISPSTNESEVKRMIEKARAVDPSDWKEISSMIWLVFSDPEALNHSFLLPEPQGVKVVENTAGKKNEKITVDVEAVRRTYEVLLGLEVPAITNALENAMSMYCSALARNKQLCQVEPLNHLVLLLENPQLHSPEFTASSGKLLAAVAGLHIQQKEMLVRFYATYPVARLQEMVANFQQLITMQLLFSDDEPKPRGGRNLPQQDPLIASSTKVMMLFFFANLLMSQRSGVVRPMSSRMSSIAANPKPRFMDVVDSEFDQLLVRLKVHPVNVLRPALQWEEFRNEELNGRINMIYDYQFFGDPFMGEVFSFLKYPFILSTANKVEKLLLDNRTSHINERQRTIVHTLLTGVRDTLFLQLHISRDNIVADTLSQLEAISEMNPVDLRKQMRVEFKGEEGLDEGGLQKELFQLLIEKLLDPMYGLFTYNEMTRLHWFNPASFETEKQLRLIGLLFGLAIYNNIILDVHFPMVVYIKLLGCQTVFQDLYSSHPQIAQSLQSMLDYEAEDFQETFMATFRVSFSDMFGNLQTFDLREGGDKIPVTLANRQEYVEEYSNWLLNDSISSHFNAFKDGFDLVMGQNHLADLFLPGELEMMVCGSNDWDIDALEESTRYDGFKKTDRVVVDFWQIVRGFSESEKRRLLEFITGSDRIPLGGMAKLKFIIVKNGPDSDRLPTAHTCFNALLMCEYSSKEKLRERLTKAISYAKGFGML